MLTIGPSFATDPATTGVLSSSRVAALRQQSGRSIEQLMEELVPFARVLAQPMVSRYHVGVVARGSSGALYYGANLEFPGQTLPFTVHAEQSATTNAWNNGETELTSVAVSAAPCGYCRQFLYETTGAARMDVMVAGRAKTTLTPGLLPEAFGPSDLGVKTALMAPESVSLQLQQPSSHPLVLEALKAAERSYAPYTNSYAGAAVQDTTGRIFPGRLAENAAYNPSLSPLASALAMAALARVSQTAIAEVALVEVANAAVSQLPVTQTLVDALGVGSFTYALAT
ncbi:MAG: cytidine deaminase [Baekduia sp.]